MNECLFCKIANKSMDAVILWEDSDLVIFLDNTPLREAHCQIITKEHYETFDAMPPELAAKVLHAGQRLARKLKATYHVDRVAFLFTGGDVPHAYPLQLDVAALSHRQWLVRRPAAPAGLRHRGPDRQHLQRPVVPGDRGLGHAGDRGAAGEGNPPQRTSSLAHLSLLHI